MAKLQFAHHNNCPRCPIIGAEDITGEEFFELWDLRFSIAVARKLAVGKPLVSADSSTVEHWLGWASVDKRHLDHVPNKGFGIVVTLPNGIGTPMIDGNHRTLAALIDRKHFSAVVFNQEETHHLLRLSMGPALADEYWEALKISRSNLSS